ncbi:reverse transcriptase family protein [Rhodocyclus tenuis]|uniref:RNA-directed DNA polymerase n=1 Tax=Rhodocyclus tenuis TaxID=1066 RepID=A0A840GIM2_RHOTE|nr:reverse transcriptase family protein [Rhodocyclus tenuis]MBB4248029.1 hypothetical protein [Rhodocyclus tenuis]
MPLQVTYRGSPIRSLEALSSALSCDEPILKHISNHVADYYTFFEIEKKSGGARQIKPPKPILKAIQKRINSRIFSLCEFPEYLQGSIKDATNPRDFVSNARAHSNGKTVVAADIKNFYPSVTESNVKEIFKYLFRFSDDVTAVLVALTTLDNSLPQGAPTSSYLANLVFYNNEHKLVTELRRKGLIYTRLIDDITVSSPVVLDKNEQEWIIRKIKGFTASKGLELHRGKLKVCTTSTPGANVIVTGLWIDRGHPRISREARNKIRAAVHRCKKEHEAGHKTLGEFHDRHNSVSGSVALISRLGHTQGKQYRLILNENLPEYSKEYAGKLTKICYRFSAKKGLRKETLSYTKRYYQLMYHLSILGRSDKKKANFLRSLLKQNPPKHCLRELSEE